MTGLPAGTRFAADLAYGPGPAQRLDIFLPDAAEPAPLVIYIHGGGFLSGDKSYPYSVQQNGAWDLPDTLRQMLAADVAFASINYTLLDAEVETEGVAKSLRDGRVALQFLRYHAEALNLDKARVVLAGNSAGAGMALWLATADEMAQPEATDPVLRESTRVSGVALREVQATYDMRRWATELYASYGISFNLMLDVSEHRILNFYGLGRRDELDGPEFDAYARSVDMLAEFSADDPPLWVSNVLRPVAVPLSAELINHHPYQARAIRQQAELVGMEGVYYIATPAYPEDYFASDSGETMEVFMLRMLDSVAR